MTATANVPDLAQRRAWRSEFDQQHAEITKRETALAARRTKADAALAEQLRRLKEAEQAVNAVKGESWALSRERERLDHRLVPQLRATASPQIAAAEAWATAEVARLREYVPATQQRRTVDGFVPTHSERASQLRRLEVLLTSFRHDLEALALDVLDEGVLAKRIAALIEALPAITLEPVGAA